MAVPAASVNGATLYEQLNASTLGETNTEHIGTGNPTQKLGTGLSGVFRSMAYKVNGSTIASDIGVTQGYGGFVLYSCFTSSYSLPCSKVAESSSPPQILSQSGNDAYLLATTTSAYTFVASSYYYLMWITTGDMAFYGSASDTYTNGLAQWLTGTVFDADANIADIAFRICDGSTCDLVPPDTTPPVIAGTPDNIVAEATNSAGASVTYTAPTATDTVDGTDPVSCVPASGSGFAIDSTTVTCSTADAAGNAASSSFVIRVADTTAPVVTLTGDATVSLTVGGTFTDQGATATDLGASTAVTTTGSVDTATAGTYTLTYSATDASGNTASTTRTVTVTAPPPAPAPEPARSSGGGGGGGGVIGGPLSVGYQIPYLPPPPPPAPTPPPAPEPVPPAPAPAQTRTSDVLPAPVQNQGSDVQTDVQTPAAPEPTATTIKSPVAVATPWDRPVSEQIPMGAAIATSGLQMPSFVAMGAAMLLLALSAAMALRHSKVA